MGVAVEGHTKENPRCPYAVGLKTQPALVVRGSSRRITIMRFRPANIRVINRRKSSLDRYSRRFLRECAKERKTELVVDRSFHIRGAAPLRRGCPACILVWVWPFLAVGVRLQWHGLKVCVRRGPHSGHHGFALQ